MATASDTTEITESGPSVELLEPDSLGFSDDHTTSSETVGSASVGGDPSVNPKVVIPASILAIVVALAIFSRPGPPVRLDEESQTTVPTTAVPTTSVPGQTTVTASRQPPATQAVPTFDENVTADIPGVISAFDAAGSLIVIDRQQFRPEENRLELQFTDVSPATVLMVNGAPPIGLVQRLSFDGSAIQIELNQDRFVNPSFRLSDIIPDLDGKVLLLNRGNNAMTVTLAPVAFDNPDGGQVLQWEVPGQPNVLGYWQDQLVVERADRIWLLDESLDATDVATGRVLTFDGEHLARLVCQSPISCELRVGPPDDPDRRSVALPRDLAVLSEGDWVEGIGISPDGDRLALSVRQGGLSLPTIVDLETGELRKLADGMNHRSPVVWSPDGEWVAYLYTDDVMVWRLEAGRSWRVAVNREMVSLLWR